MREGGGVWENFYFAKRRKHIFCTLVTVGKKNTALSSEKYLIIIFV